MAWEQGKTHLAVLTKQLHTNLTRIHFNGFPSHNSLYYEMVKLTQNIVWSLGVKAAASTSWLNFSSRTQKQANTRRLERMVNVYL